MKFRLLLILSLFLLAACKKDSSIVEVETPPPTAPPDSAQNIYVIGENRLPPNNLYVYGANRQELWKLTGISRSAGILALSDSFLYMDDGAGRMFALNAQTGVMKWEAPAGYNLRRVKIHGDTIVTASSTIAPSSSNQLLLFNKNTGQLFWNLVVTDQPVVTPVISDGKIYSLTTNGTGTQLNLAAYDLPTRTEVWKKPVSTGFLMSGLPEMIVRGDTLIMGAFGNAVTLVNKHTGAIYWSKGIDATQSFLINNEIVYIDQGCGCVKKISLATGATTFQGQRVPFISSGKSYVYNNHLYTHYHDSLYRTNLVDGVLRRTKIEPAYYTQYTVVGKTVYAAKNLYAGIQEARIMILQADDLEPKDSIVVPTEYLRGFTVLSTTKRVY